MTEPSGESEKGRLQALLVAELVLLAMSLVLPFMPSKSAGGPLIVRPESLGTYATSVLLVWLAINGVLAGIVIVALLSRYLKERWRQG